MTDPTLWHVAVYDELTGDIIEVRKSWHMHAIIEGGCKVGRKLLVTAEPVSCESHRVDLETGMLIELPTP